MRPWSRAKNPDPAVVAGASDGVDVRSTRGLYLWMLCGLLLEYSRVPSLIPGFEVLRPYSVIPILLFVIVALSKNPALRPWEVVFSDIYVRWILFFVFLIALSMLHADVKSRAYEIFEAVLGSIFYFILILRLVVTRARLLGVFGVLLLAHLILIVLNPQFILDPTNRYYIEGATFLGDTNDYTLSLCILIPMVIELALAQRNALLKGLFWFVVLVLCLSIVSSQSRGAAIGIAAVLIYLWLISPRKALTLVGFVLLGGIMLWYASDEFFDRMATISNYESEGSAMGRVTAWKAAMQMMFDHPLLGVGAGHFNVAFGIGYMPADIVGPYPWLTAHSIYFLIIGELGIPGIVALLVLVIGNPVANSRLRRTVLALPPDQVPGEHQNGARTLHMLNASMVGFAVAGAFLSAIYYPHLYILVGLMAVQRRMLINGLGIPADTPRFGRGRARRSRAAAARQGGPVPGTFPPGPQGADPRSVTKNSQAGRKR